jgi:NitT/TauT family transport system permease protein
MKNRTAISAGAVMLFLIAWESAPRLHLVNPVYTSQPSRVAAAAVEVVRNGSLPRDVAVSASEFAAGFALAVVIGVPLGLLLGVSRPLRYLIDPPIMALYATPYLALLPILVVWLGIGLASKIAAVFVGGVIPIVVNSIAGVRHVERSWILAARSYGASELDVFVKVILPGSLPGVLSGIRLGLSRAVLAVVIAEMYVSQAGLGSQIIRYGAAFRIDALLVYVLLVSAFGFLATRLVQIAEDRIPR